MKHIVILSIMVIVVLLATAGVLFYKSTTNSIFPPSTTAVPTKTENQSQIKGNISLTSPRPNETVSLPIIIQGKARVFENQFNYRVRDVNKNIILEGTSYANNADVGEYGDYSIQITSLPSMRANAITLEVFDYSAKDGSEIDSVSIPVVFDASKTIPVEAYFSNKQTSAGQECTAVYKVEHHVEKTQATARAALEELLKGPMTIEKNNGYYTNINQGVIIQKLTIGNGLAKVDFNEKLEEGVGGSCRVSAIRTQITKSLEQFPTIHSVIISINGRTEDVLQP